MTTPVYVKLPGFLLACFISTTLLAQTTQPQPAAYNQKLQSAQLIFMENSGQVADDKGNLRPDILFTANSGGAKIYLTNNSIHYQFTKTAYPKGYDPNPKEPVKNPTNEDALRKQIKTSTHRFTVELQGANLHPIISTDEQSVYTENYYLAQCPNGITGVHGYENIIYKNVYPHIDWIIYSKGGFMEYDFLVHPGGNPANIQLKVKDADSVSINDAGELVMKTSLGEVREKAPVSFANGALVESYFKQLGGGVIGFDVQPQLGKELRIDPSIVWSTYYRGNSGDEGLACTTDKNGNVFLSGDTKSNNTISFGSYQNTFTGIAVDAFFVKFDSSGVRKWATYYGGGNSEFGRYCVADNSGNVYLIGQTSSTSGIASNGFQNVYGGGYGDAFVVKLNASGVRQWGTYCGGSAGEVNRGGMLSTNYIYIEGFTESSSGIANGGFQNTLNGYQDAYLTKININLSITNFCPSSYQSINSFLTGSTYQWQIDNGCGFINLTNNTNYSGTTTQILQTINLSTSFYGYQYMERYI